MYDHVPISYWRINRTINLAFVEVILDHNSIRRTYYDNRVAGVDFPWSSHPATATSVHCLVRICFRVFKDRHSIPVLILARHSTNSDVTLQSLVSVPII
jgi:hypothetical protein